MLCFLKENQIKFFCGRFVCFHVCIVGSPTHIKPKSTSNQVRWKKLGVTEAAATLRLKLFKFNLVKSGLQVGQSTRPAVPIHRLANRCSERDIVTKTGGGGILLLYNLDR